MFFVEDSRAFVEFRFAGGETLVDAVELSAACLCEFFVLVLGGDASFFGVEFGFTDEGEGAMLCVGLNRLAAFACFTLSICRTWAWLRLLPR